MSACAPAQFPLDRTAACMGYFCTRTLFSRIDRTIPARFSRPRRTMSQLIIEAAGLTDVGSFDDQL
jgi:hypothetical protein